MQKYVVSWLIALFAFGQAGVSHAATSSIEACIGENSGADSVTCLAQLFYRSERQLAQLELQFRRTMRQRRAKDELPETHHKLALVELAQASANFKRYRERECYFIAYNAGGVASGFQQVRYACLIQANQHRIQLLQQP